MTACQSWQPHGTCTKEATQTTQRLDGSTKHLCDDCFKMVKMISEEILGPIDQETINTINKLKGRVRYDNLL